MRLKFLKGRLEKLNGKLKELSERADTGMNGIFAEFTDEGDN